MNTLLKELDKLLEAKNETIAVLEWQLDVYKKENEELQKENKELKTDIEKYEEKRGK